MKRSLLFICFIVLFGLSGCSSVNKTTDITTAAVLNSQTETKDTVEIDGGYIESSSFEDFFITFDSVMNYSAQYFVGSDKEFSYLKEKIHNAPLNAHYLSLISGELHGDGIVQINTSTDSSIIGHAGEFAPYLDLELEKGTYTVYFKNQIIVFFG